MHFGEVQDNVDHLYQALLFIGIKPSMAGKISSNSDLYTEPAFLRFLVEIAPKTASRIVKIVHKLGKPIKFNETLIKFTKLLRFNDDLFRRIMDTDTNGFIDIDDLFKAAEFIHYRYGLRWGEILFSNHPSKWLERLEVQMHVDYANEPDLKWDEKFK